MQEVFNAINYYLYCEENGLAFRDPCDPDCPVWGTNFWKRIGNALSGFVGWINNYVSNLAPGTGVFPGFTLDDYIPPIGIGIWTNPPGGSSSIVIINYDPEVQKILVGCQPCEENNPPANFCEKCQKFTELWQYFDGKVAYCLWENMTDSQFDQVYDAWSAPGANQDAIEAWLELECGEGTNLSLGQFVQVYTKAMTVISNLSLNMEDLNWLISHPTVTDYLYNKLVLCNFACDDETLNDYEFLSAEPFINTPSSGIISDLSEALNCFQTTNLGTAVLEVTVYVDKPDATVGERDPWKPLTNVGHAWLMLTQSVTNQPVRRLNVGFYPSPDPGGGRPWEPDDEGVFINDENHHFDISITIELEVFQFTGILAAMASWEGKNYNLNSANCTDFVIQVLQTGAGITLPDTQGNWPMGGGSNPGDFGEDLRNLTLSPSMSRNTLGGGPPCQVRTAINV